MTVPGGFQADTFYLHDLQSFPHYLHAFPTFFHEARRRDLHGRPSTSKDKEDTWSAAA